MTRKALLEKALSLPKAERIALVHDLWDSIAEEPDNSELTDVERKLLDERIAAYERNPAATRTWEQVKRDARKAVRAMRRREGRTGSLPVSSVLRRSRRRRENNRGPKLSSIRSEHDHRPPATC
jgi:putative addiction module component (TIGR02574 family)